MAADQPRVGHALGACRLDIVLLHHHKRRTPHDACHQRHGRDGQRQHDREQARAEDRRDRQPEQDRREGKQHVHQPHDEAVKTLVEGRDEAEHGTQAAARSDCGDAHQQRHAQAEEQAGDHVAPLRVRAERQALTSWRLHRLGQVVVEGIGWRQPGRQDGGKDDRQGEGGSHGRGRIPQQQRQHARALRDRDVGRGRAHAWRIRGSSAA
jgi:hypothetical protein